MRMMIAILDYSEAGTRGVLSEKVFLEFSKLTRKHLSQGLLIIFTKAEACNFVRKETLVQVLTCEFLGNF